MDLDALLHHYFGTDDPETLSPAEIQAGCDRVLIAFGTEREPGRRFALWALLHALGAAPDPVEAFKEPREQQAAMLYARAAESASEPDG